ncbi:hypothetical protein NKG94_34880 [Micromonospora sp. M12]
MPAVAGALTGLATAGTVVGFAVPSIDRPGTPATSTIEGWLRVLGLGGPVRALRGGGRRARRRGRRPVATPRPVTGPDAGGLDAGGLWRPSAGGGDRPGRVTAALLGASVAVVVGGTIRSVLSEPVPATGPQPYALTVDEMRAALWLDDNAADDDVVATNVHCRPVRTTRTATPGRSG